MENTPLIHGGILRFEGRVMTIVPNESTCYRCIFKNPPPPGVVPTCQEAGIIGVVAGIIGTIQATEAIKLILKIGQPLTDRPNDACYMENTPLIHGGILRFEGRVMTIVPNESTCYRCIFKNPPPPGVVPTCQEAGIIGVVAGIIDR